VEISTVNFTTGVSDPELLSRTPDSSFDFAHIDCDVCHGNIVAVYLRWTQVLNWRTRSRILVSMYKESSQIMMAIVPGYLILVLPASAR
jgi:hypothetical protein